MEHFLFKEAGITVVADTAVFKASSSAVQAESWSGVQFIMSGDQNDIVVNCPPCLNRVVSLYRTYSFAVKSLAGLVSTIVWISENELKDDSRAEVEISEDFAADDKEWPIDLKTLRKALSVPDKYRHFEVTLSPLNVHALHLFSGLALTFRLDICLKKLPIRYNLAADLSGMLFRVNDSVKQLISARVFATGLSPRFTENLTVLLKGEGVTRSLFEDYSIPLIITPRWRRGALGKFKLGFELLQVLDFSCVVQSRYQGALIAKYFSWVYKFKPTASIVYRCHSTNTSGYFCLEISEEAQLNLILEQAKVIDIVTLLRFVYLKESLSSIELRSRQYGKWECDRDIKSLFRTLLQKRVKFIQRRQFFRASIDFTPFVLDHCATLVVEQI